VRHLQPQCEELVKEGALLGASPAGVMASCDIVIGMLADPSAAEAVALGPHGVIESAGAGKAYIDMSTVDEATSTKIGTALSAKGARFLEVCFLVGSLGGSLRAWNLVLTYHSMSSRTRYLTLKGKALPATYNTQAPVSGSKKPAIEGKLVILAAGDKTLYDDAAPAFNLLGTGLFYLGDTGAGARMKLVVNMIMGSMMGRCARDCIRCTYLISTFRTWYGVRLPHLTPSNPRYMETRTCTCL
jgi:3-hydroxyisobutyrate dehydrogenase-like beta-hydroxyacid dehydrogenase